jgi:hypothetical protein
VTPPAWIAIVSIVITLLSTFTIFLANVIFKTGSLHTRVEVLEQWRINLRQDMHEISDKLGDISEELKMLNTLVTERTERRKEPRS